MDRTKLLTANRFVLGVLALILVALFLPIPVAGLQAGVSTARVADDEGLVVASLLIDILAVVLALGIVGFAGLVVSQIALAHGECIRRARRLGMTAGGLAFLVVVVGLLRMTLQAS